MSFYPRHPRGWRRPCTFPFKQKPPGFYPRHPRGWRQAYMMEQLEDMMVSIHATLAGGDRYRRCHLFDGKCFYPRHPRGWRPFDGISSTILSSPFLSTPPSRVATSRIALIGGCVLFLSTPPSRVATNFKQPKDKPLKKFLSTPPSRVATRENYFYLFGGKDVSIHATLAGGDYTSQIPR